MRPLGRRGVYDPSARSGQGGCGCLCGKASRRDRKAKLPQMRRRDRQLRRGAGPAGRVGGSSHIPRRCCALCGQECGKKPRLHGGRIKNIKKSKNSRPIKRSACNLFRIVSVDLQRLPQRVYIIQGLLLEIAVGVLVVQLTELVNLGVENFHGLLAHLFNIALVGVDGGVGGGVVDKRGVRDGGLGREHVVDEALGELLVLAAGGNAHRVDKIVGAFGIVELQIHILGLRVDHGEVVACVVTADGGLAGLHHVVDLIHDIALDQGSLLLELSQRLIPFGMVGAVYVDPQLILGGAESVARVVELEDIALVLLVPQQIPAAGIRRVHDIGVIDHADHAVGIRHGILVVGIIIEIAEGLTDVFVVGDIVEVQLEQHILLEHAGDHVVGGDDHVEADSAAGELGVHVFVAGISGVVDLDLLLVGFLIPLLKLADGIEGILRAVGDIFAPVVDIERQGLGASASAAAGEEYGAQQHCGKRESNGSFHVFASLACFLLSFFSLRF